jgi:dolichol-phosphate mannosyltransferase
MKKAIVIIPTYNEKENIGGAVLALLDVFEKVPGWQLGILVVDDNSPDRTYEVVEDLSKQHKSVDLLLNKNKSGLGGAYLKGMAMAFNEMSADVVFEFDADLSHDPSKIPAFLQAIENGGDLVLGSRYIPGGGIPDNWGLHRKLLSKVGNLFINVVLANFSIRDWTTGYRAIKKEVYHQVLPYLQSERFSGYTFQIGFLFQAVNAGFKIVEVPFQFVDRTYGSSKLGPEYIKNTLIFILKVRIMQILQNKVFKFAAVGGVGFLVQLLFLQLYRSLLPEFQFLIFTDFLVATLFSIETAILSNFVLNNIWTFSDRKLKSSQLPRKFVQFNMASVGSIVIQLIINGLGEFLIGIFTLLVLPIINLKVDTGMVFAVLGIMIGMFWNFFAYNKFIWKKAK